MSISYDQKTWYNGEEGGTPITASELNRMEQGIADAVEAINEGGGGGGGTSDYPDLTNKPSINGVELLGNKLVGLLSTDIQINAEKIGYSGTVSGANTAKAAIESLQSGLSSKGNASISAVSGTTDTFTISNGSTSSNFYDTSGVADCVEAEVDYQLYHKATFAYVTLHAWGGFQSTDRVWLRNQYEDYEGELSGSDYEFTVAYCDTYSIYVGSDINSASKRGEIKVNQMGRKYEMPIFNSGYTNYATVTVKTYDQTLVGKAIEVKLSNSSQKVARFVFDEELTYTFHTNYLQEHQVIYKPTYDAQTSIIATVEPQNYGSTYMVSIATSNPKDYSRFTAQKFTGKKLMIAHRGASYECPEQSLAAYNWAGKFKFDGAECDVQFTSDNVPILMHDSTVDRTTNGSGTVASLTASQITALTIDYAENASGLTYYPSEKVPTLEQYLKVCKYWGMFPVIEIKEADLTIAKAQIIVDLVVKYGLLEDAIFIGWVQNNLLNLMSVDARCKCMPLIDITQANVDWCVEHKMIGIDCDYTTNLTQSKVQLCHDNGLLVGMWTINDVTNAMTCNDYGVDMQTSNSIEFAFDCYNKPSWCDYDVSEMHGITPTNEYEWECLALGKYLKRVYNANTHVFEYDTLPQTDKPRAVLCKKFNISKNIKFSYSFPSTTRVTNVTMHGFYKDPVYNAVAEDIGWFTTNKTDLYGISKTYTQNVSEGIIYIGTPQLTDALTYLELEKLYKDQIISVVNEFQNKITASTTDIIAGTTALGTGDIYVVYE